MSVNRGGGEDLQFIPVGEEAANGPVFYSPGDTATHDSQDFTVVWQNDTVVGTLNSTVRFEAFLPPPSGMAAIPAPAFSPAGRAALTAAILGVAGWSFARRRLESRRS